MPETEPDSATQKLVANERAKLTANNLDRASTACFTVGIATPLAGYLYRVSGIDTLPWWWLASGFVGWLIAATSLHLLARRILRGLLP